MHKKSSQIKLYYSLNKSQQLIPTHSKPTTYCLFLRFPFAIIFFQDISSITFLDGTTFVKRDNKIAGESSKLMIAAGPI